MKMIYRGSMPAPKKEHGDELLGGIILGRSWSQGAKEWVYRIQHHSGHILYGVFP